MSKNRQFYKDGEENNLVVKQSSFLWNSHRNQDIWCNWYLLILMMSRMIFPAFSTLPWVNNSLGDSGESLKSKV